MDIKIKRKINRAINRFQSAVEEKAFKGSYHPDTWDGIEEEYKKSKELLYKTINLVMIESSL